MSRCNYCGVDNDGAAAFCPGCGSEVAKPREETPNVPKTRGEELRGWPALVILLVYFGGQIFGGGIAAGIGFLIRPGHDHLLHNPQEVRAITSALMPGAALGAMVGGAIAMFAMAFALVPRSLRDRSPTGAAWVTGSWMDAGRGLALGMIIGFASWGLMIYLEKIHRGPTSLGPIARMACTPGLGFLAWLTGVLILAPVIEELLFRGLLYGGFRQSLGAENAGVFTSAIFVLMHGSEVIHFLPAVIGIASFAACAIWLRLRSTAIGPAIAAHFGYNAVLALSVYRTIY